MEEFIQIDKLKSCSKYDDVRRGIDQIENIC